MREADESESGRDSKMLASKTAEGTMIWAAPEAGRGVETDSPLQPPKGTESSPHLDLSPVRPFQTSDLQKYI